MKYMGSKRSLLRNGLGRLILDESVKCTRVVDLFSGSGAVAWFAAEQTDRPVVAVDLQSYAVVLARAVICRTIPLDPRSLDELWLEQVRRLRAESHLREQALSIERKASDVRGMVEAARLLCGSGSSPGPVWSAYGGY